jgi:acyl carrier protein
MDKQTKIVEIVRRVAGKPVSPAPDESLFESGLLDSFSLTDLVTAVESEFAIRVPDSDLTPRKFDSIERIQAYIESRS